MIKSPFNKILVMLSVSLITSEAIAKQWAILAEDYADLAKIQTYSQQINSMIGVQNPQHLFNSGSTQKALKITVLKNIGIVVVETNSKELESQLTNLFVNHDIIGDSFYKLPKIIKHDSQESDNQTFALLRRNETIKGKVPWGVAKVKANEAWADGAAGKGAKVVVLDSGVDKNVNELKGRLLGAKSFISSDSPSELDPYRDDDGHGTHVSGTIVADGTGGGLLGVAPQAQLYVGKVCAEFCSIINVAKGLDWAIEKGAHVVNMSLGASTVSPVLERALERASAANIVAVAAAGNTGLEGIDHPASSIFTIAVGATNKNDKRAEFSQHGDGLDVMAPGEGVLSTVPKGTGRDTMITVVDAVSKVNAKIKAAQFTSSPTETAGINLQFVDAKTSLGGDVVGIDVDKKFALVDVTDSSPTHKSILNLKNSGAKGVILVSQNEDIGNGSTDGELDQFPIYMIAKSNAALIRKALTANASLVANLKTAITDSAEFSGTSMASPHVAGVVALMKAIAPEMTLEQTRELLKGSSKKIGSKLEYGSGLVEAPKAVDAVLSADLRFR